jgi:hypothetical protein
VARIRCMALCLPELAVTDAAKSGLAKMAHFGLFW